MWNWVYGLLYIFRKDNHKKMVEGWEGFGCMSYLECMRCSKDLRKDKMDLDDKVESILLVEIFMRTSRKWGLGFVRVVG